MQEWLDSFNLLVKSLHSAPTYAVFCSCVVVGYVLRCIKSFPNDAIPAVVVCWGALANSVMSTEHGPSLSLNQEKFLAAMIGMVIGLLAWLLHKKLLKKLETKLPFLANLLDSGNSNPVNDFDRSKDGISYGRDESKTLLEAKEPKPLN